jgi:hypothetical protein
MYQVVYFKNSRGLASNLKKEYVSRYYERLNIAVYNEEIYSLNTKSHKRIITLSDISSIPTGYVIVKTDDWDTAYNYFLGKRHKILIADSDDGRIVIEAPYNMTIEEFRSETIVLPFVTQCIIDEIFDVTPLLRFPPILDNGPVGGTGKEPKPTKNPIYINIPYTNHLNWALQNVQSAEAWELIEENAPSSEPVTITLFDTRVDTEHPDLVGKIDPTSVNYMAVYENITSDWVNTPALFIQSCSTSGSLSGLTSYGLNKLSNLLHGTGVAGVLAANNSDNVLASSPSNDCVKIRLAVISDGFRDGMTCNQLSDTLENQFSQFSTILAWEMALSREGYYYQPNTAAYVIPYKLPLNSDLISMLNSFTNRLEYNREGRGSVLFASHGNEGIDDANLIWEQQEFSNTYLVSSSNIYNTKSNFSNYGSLNFIAAPGESVLTTSTRGTLADGNLTLNQYLQGGSANPNPALYQNSYSLLKLANGTSISAAFVASIWATMVYTRPLLTEAQGIDILKETSRKVGEYSYDESGRSDELGYGIIDHEAAIQGVLDLLPDISNINWPELEPIEVNISDAPDEILDDTATLSSVEFIVDILNPDVVPLVRRINSSVWICDNNYFDYNSCYLVAEHEMAITAQTNTDDSINITVPIYNTCSIPTGEKQLFVRSQIFGYGNESLSYGITQDNVSVTVTNTTEGGDFLLNDSIFCRLNGISLDYLGLVSLGNGQSTTSPAGVAWKFRIELPGTPASWGTVYEVIAATIRILRWNEDNQVWDWVTLAFPIIEDNSVVDGWNNLRLNPFDGAPYPGSNEPENPGLVGGQFRERLFVFVNPSYNALGQLIQGLPNQMRAEISSVRVQAGSTITTINLSTEAHGPNLRTDFTLTSWPGLTPTTGTNLG